MTPNEIPLFVRRVICLMFFQVLTIGSILVQSPRPPSRYKHVRETSLRLTTEKWPTLTQNFNIFAIETKLGKAAKGGLVLFSRSRSQCGTRVARISRECRPRFTHNQALRCKPRHPCRFVTQSSNAKKKRKIGKRSAIGTD